jgi:hypothetical protein
MGAGSTIGLWTFTDKLQSGQFPLQLWTPATRQRVALTMVQFLQQQKFEKTPRLAAAWEVATNVVAHSEHITVLLITSGTDAVTGTPFDAEIAESFGKNTEAQRKQNMPFLTILRAAGGRFVSHAVNMPPWPLEVPAYPDGFKPIAAPTAPIETKPATPVGAPPKFDRTQLSPTNTIYLSETPASGAVPVIETLSEPTNAVVAAPPLPPTAATAPTPVVAKVEPTPTPNMEAAPAIKKLAAEASEAGTPRKFPIVTILIAGIAVLLAVLVVFIALLRWSRHSPGASLITRSMDKDR